MVPVAAYSLTATGWAHWDGVRMNSPRVAISGDSDGLSVIPLPPWMLPVTSNSVFRQAHHNPGTPVDSGLDRLSLSAEPTSIFRDRLSKAGHHFLHYFSNWFEHFRAPDLVDKGRQGAFATCAKSICKKKRLT